MILEWFKCKKCGSRELNVEHEYHLHLNGVIEHCYEIFELDNDHHFNEQIENDTTDKEWCDCEGECEFTNPEDESTIVSIKWSVVCAGCNRSIPFGWSHPNRGGRIWPTEGDDFGIGGMAWMEKT